MPAIKEPELYVVAAKTNTTSGSGEMYCFLSRRDGSASYLCEVDRQAHSGADIVERIVCAAFSAGEPLRVTLDESKPLPTGDDLYHFHSVAAYTTVVPKTTTFYPPLPDVFTT
jgi:hypothetical protein